MFLDDDDMFYSKQALEIIAKNLYTENDILFWKVKLGNNIIYPKNINNITQFNISVKIPDKFIESVDADTNWNLEWGGPVY